MSIEDIFRESHGNIKNTLIPITIFDKNVEKELGIVNSQLEYIEVLKEKVPDLVNDIYYVHNGILTFFVYEKKFVQVEIFSLNWEDWEMFQLEKKIRYWNQKMDVLEKEGNYEDIFTIMEKRILIPNYIEYFEVIPDEQKYNIFRALWTRNEYGFDLFEPEFLEEVFSYRKLSSEWEKAMKELREETGGKEVIKIYRGVTEKSTPAEKALAWTLDKEVAKFFATRFNSDGDVYEAEIKIDDVYDYIMDRSEKELLVNPEAIFNINSLDE